MAQDTRLKSVYADALAALGLKFCPGCDRTLSLDDFGKGSAAHGRQAYCRPCVNERNRQSAERTRQREGDEAFRARRAAQARKRKRVRPPCGIDGCDTKQYALGWCFHHYSNNRLRGDPMLDGPGKGAVQPRRGCQPPCSVDGCADVSLARQLCQLHYNRWLRHGDPGHVERQIAVRGRQRRLNRDGYVVVCHPVTGKAIREHRLVMEQQLGRPLLPNENVHHLNGDRADNRPENLELWVKSQPCGQRVPDLLAWARYIIDTYGSLG